MRALKAAVDAISQLDLSAQKEIVPDHRPPHLPDWGQDNGRLRCGPVWNVTEERPAANIAVAAFEFEMVRAPADVGAERDDDTVMGSGPGGRRYGASEPDDWSS